MNNFETYNQRLEIINEMKSDSREKAREKKRLKNLLIREIAPKFRQTEQQEYLELIFKIFNRAMHTAVYYKIPVQSRKDVLDQIQIAISILAQKGVKQSTHFPLEDADVDQVAYINSIISHKIYDYYEYPRRPAEEDMENSKQPSEEIVYQGSPPKTLRELIDAGKVTEGEIPVDKMIQVNTFLEDDQGGHGEQIPGSPRREIQIDPLFDAVFGGRNILDPETAAIKNQIDEIAKNKMFEEIEKIEDKVLREILLLRIKNSIPFKVIGAQVFPYLSPEKAEELARNKYEYYSKNIVTSLRKDPVIKKLLNLK